MDLLFKRYASPFLFIDGMIQAGRFSEFVTSFIDVINAEKEEEVNWQFFLHKVFDGSYADFKKKLHEERADRQMSEERLEAMVKQSMNILDSFNPEQSGGEK